MAPGVLELLITNGRHHELENVFRFLSGKNLFRLFFLIKKNTPIKSTSFTQCNEKKSKNSKVINSN